MIFDKNKINNSHFFIMSIFPTTPLYHMNGISVYQIDNNLVIPNHDKLSICKKQLCSIGFKIAEKRIAWIAKINTSTDTEKLLDILYKLD